MTENNETTVTLREVLAAARQNGFEHVRDSWFQQKWDVEKKEHFIDGACALGQAAINLGIEPYSLRNKRVKNEAGSRREPFLAIIRLNDNTEKGYNLNEIADNIEKRYADVLDVPVTVTKAEYPHVIRKGNE